MSRAQIRCFFIALLLTPLTAKSAGDVPESTAVKSLGGDLFEAGGIRFDAKAKTASFPATVNMRSGLLEYLLVGESGKTHESLFATTIQPAQLHTVMLLLGARGSPPQNPSAPPSAITADSLQMAKPLAGDRISISVRWKKSGAEQRAPAEDLILNGKTHKPMRRGPWLYNGSYFFDGQFLAQEDKSFAALVIDPEALMNNPRPGNDDDEIWSPNTKKIGPLHAPVEITITLLPALPPSPLKP